MRLALLALSALCYGQHSFCVTAKPQPPKQSALTLGTARDFFTWELIIRSSGPVSRPEIMERLPITALLEWQAVDVLTRRAAGDPRSVFAAYFGVVKDAGPAALAYAAGRITDPYAKIGMLAASGVWALAGGRAQARIPNPGQTVAHLLPDAGVTGDWDGIIVTGIVRGAAKIGPLCGIETAGFDDGLGEWRLSRIMETRHTTLGD